MEINKTLLNQIPKKYHNAINSIYKDEDGYWAYIGNGYKVKDYFADHVIHEDTVTMFKKVFKQIVKE